MSRAIPPPPPSTSSSAAATDRIVNRQRNIQEGITDDLLSLAGQLKENVRALETSVVERGTLLDLTEAALETSAAGVKESREQQSKVSKRSWMGFCAQLLLILFVGFAFTFMFVFIRFTSLAGYKRISTSRPKTEL